MLALAGSAAAAPSCSTTVGVTTCTFSYSGSQDSWVAPAGVTSITVDAYGASGMQLTAPSGRTNGLGAHVRATLVVTPGSTYYVTVGGAGSYGVGGGGFNGGGDGGTVDFSGLGLGSLGGGGGGATDFRTSSALSDRVVVAGGGGGDSWPTLGGNSGSDGNNGVCSLASNDGGTCVANAVGGKAGTGGGAVGGTGESVDGITGADAADVAAGSATGGAGASWPAPFDANTFLFQFGGGGGGGGYYGGSGGGAGMLVDISGLNGSDGGGGGGGGSDYVDPSATNMTVTDGGNVSSGSSTQTDGSLTITYNEPPPDLTITKTHTGDFTQGQRGDYTITVTNSGTGPTSGTVTVTDTLPSGLAAAVVVSSNVWGCFGTTSTVMTCTRSSALAAGDSSAITLTVSVASDAQSVTNTASVSGGGETNTANDSASDPTTVIDATPPNTAITAHPSDPNNNASQSFSFSGDDGSGGSGVASFECKLDAASFAPCTSAQSYGLSDGSHTFQVRAIDAAGNVDPTPASYSWTVDFLPPQTFIDGNPSDPSNDSFAQFHYTGIDNHTADSQLLFECKLDDSAFAACPLDSTFYSGLLDGSHTFQVRATDAAGNVQQFPATFTWTVDTTAPTDAPQVSGTLGTNGWYTTSVVVAWHWTDGGGSGIDTSHCTQTTTSSGDGSSVTVSSSCRDLAGNSSSDSRSFKIDTTKPKLAPTLSTGTIALNQPGVTASPGATDTGGSGVASSSCGAISTSSVGDHTVTCTATDNAGNSNSSTIHYTVGYKFGGFTSPLPKSTVNLGSTLPIKFQLQDAAGHPISDTEAQSLVSPTCKIAIILVKPAGAVSGCPTYSTTLKQFQFNLKTTNAMKGANGVSITVTIGGTIVTASAPPDPFTVK